MEDERILRIMTKFLILLMDSSGTRFERNTTSDRNFDPTKVARGESTALTRVRRRECTSLSPKQNTPNMERSKIPELEIPFSLEQTQEKEPVTLMDEYSAPGLVEVSPILDYQLSNPCPQQGGGNDADELIYETEHQAYCRSWAQQKLAAAIFSHPKPLCSFCLETYQAARDRNFNFNDAELDSSTEDVDREFTDNKYSNKIPREIYYENSILSVTLDLRDIVQEISLDVSFATVRTTVMTLDASIHLVMNLLDGVTSFNPLTFANGIFTRPINMMGMTTEVVVSGIQSVATGVGSASSIALNRISAKNRSPSPTGVTGSQGIIRRGRSPKTKKITNQKLLRKLNNLNSAAPVVSYTEIGDNDGGLSRHAKSRVQRMMHYDVSLRPFVATVKLEESFKKDLSKEYLVFDDAESDSSSPTVGPFMCTPQSFPPTPASRAHVLKRGSRFADDVVFLARDQLRVHDGLGSSNERTREMAQALTQGKRLAVFDADDASAGIELSCGQHVATKVGNLLYCSSRSMVPILRNCFVYFEMTVLRNSGGVLQTSMATLSFGLSTKEMPSTTLVGAWKGSVGLCTTGQILISGQWCSPGPDRSIRPFGDNETVGCLVCLDDSSAFETWDGTMVTATVTFNINGSIVSPHLIGATISGSDNHSYTQTQTSVPPPSLTLPLLVPAEEELYPTLTLHSPGTSVMCRFSAGDVTARSRHDIGVPPNVAVYAVDGSIVFHGEE